MPSREFQINETVVQEPLEDGGGIGPSEAVAFSSVTPSKICLAIWLREYVVALRNLNIDDEKLEMTPRQKKNVCMLALKLLQVCCDLFCSMTDVFNYGSVVLLALLISRFSQLLPFETVQGIIFNLGICNMREVTRNRGKGFKMRQ